MIPIVPPPPVDVLWSPHFSPFPRSKTQAIVIHATCGSEGPKAARQVAAMFADPKLTPRRSAHEVIDSEHVIQCVLKAAHAWHCGHTGNDTTYGIEICGQANQTRDQWLDEISIKTLSLAAARVGILAKVFGLPIVMLTADDIKAGRTGITSHAEMSKAWHESTHTDPGPGFPWDLFLTACKGATA